MSITKTKNGRIKVVSLGLQELEKVIESTSKPKEKRKIQNRINVLIKQGKT